MIKHGFFRMRVIFCLSVLTLAAADPQQVQGFSIKPVCNCFAINFNIIYQDHMPLWFFWLNCLSETEWPNKYVNGIVAEIPKHTRKNAWRSFGASISNGKMQTVEGFVHEIVIQLYRFNTKILITRDKNPEQKCIYFWRQINWHGGKYSLAFCIFV